MAATGSDGSADPKGLYAILGVPATADEADIRKAYRRLALRWHPDKNPDNPDATAEFQKISSAYEVLSDSERREMYNTTGCIDAEELNESGGGFDHAADLFAAFFGGVGSTDMDAEEQAMLDEFLRIAGGGAFRRRGPRGARAKKGKAGRGGGARSSRARGAQAAQEEQMMTEMFMAAMGGDLGMEEPPPTAACPQGHPLKKRKADATYACDLCEVHIPEGKRFMDCRKCDFSVCMKCHKKAEEEAIALEEAEECREMLEAFCEMNVTPVRQGRRLKFRCKFCSKLLDSQEAAVEHMGEAHEHEFEQALAEQASPFPMGPMVGAFPGMGPMGPMGPMGAEIFGAGGLEELFMAASMEDLLGGGPPPRAAPGGGRRKGPKRRG